VSKYAFHWQDAAGQLRHKEMYKSIKSLLKRSGFMVAVARALWTGVVDIKVIIWTVIRRHKIKSYLLKFRPK